MYTDGKHEQTLKELPQLKPVLSEVSTSFSSTLVWETRKYTHYF